MFASVVFIYCGVLLSLAATFYIVLFSFFKQHCFI